MGQQVCGSQKTAKAKKSKVINIDFLLVGGAPALASLGGESNVKRKLNLLNKYCGDEEMMEQLHNDIEKVQREIRAFEDKCTLRSRATKQLEIHPTSDVKINQSRETILGWIQQIFSTRIRQQEDISMIYIIYLGYGKRGTGDWCCSDGGFISLENILEIVQQETSLYFHENQRKERFFPLLPKIAIFSDACYSANWVANTILNEELSLTANQKKKNALIFGGASLEEERKEIPLNSMKNSGVGGLRFEDKSENNNTQRKNLPVWYKSYDHIAILGSTTEGSVAGAWFRDIEVIDEDINFVKRVISRHQTPKYYEGRLYLSFLV